MKIILYTGKGGVGKTSVAAATALRSAQLGYRTIVISTDPAHSLADSFDLPLAGVPTPIAENLWGQELDLIREVNKHWETIQRWITAVLSWRGLDALIADELAMLPGMEELSGLLYIVAHYESGLYDRIIVDCAPTGETLRLLSFPEVMRWWMDRLFPLERRVAQLMRPLMKPISSLPVPDDSVFIAAQKLFDQIDKMRTILTNPDESTVRLVVNPEKMVIKEAQRTYTYLNLYGYATDLVVCNRLIPEGITDPYFLGWRDSQQKYYHLIEEGFSPLPIIRVPLMEQEVVGLEMLDRVARAAFGDEDPTVFRHVGRTQEVHKRDGDYILSLALPFTSREAVSLAQSEDELVITVGSQRRNLVLPRTLRGLTPQDARYEGDRLEIRFR